MLTGESRAFEPFTARSLGIVPLVRPCRLKSFCNRIAFPDAWLATPITSLRLQFGRLLICKLDYWEQARNEETARVGPSRTRTTCRAYTDVFIFGLRASVTQFDRKILIPHVIGVFSPCPSILLCNDLEQMIAVRIAISAIGIRDPRIKPSFDKGSRS